ncbi:MAG: hypothetical protein ABTQ25_12445 [Nitrosomonas ureae]
MKLNKLIFALALAMPGHFVFATEEIAKPAPDVQQVSEEEVVTALIALIRAGVITVEDGKVVVKEPSVLDQLRENGRATVQKAADDSICL